MVSKGFKRFIFLVFFLGFMLFCFEEVKASACVPGCSSKKECINGVCEFIIAPEVYWKNKYGFYLGEGTTRPNLTVSTNTPTTLKLTLKEPNYLVAGTTVKFNIWEKDLLNDDFITTITAIANSSNEAVGYWQIDFSTIDKKTNNDYDRFYFKTTTNNAKNIRGTSNNLKLIKYSPDLAICTNKPIVTCEGYTTKESCEFNDCSVSFFGGITDCGEETRNVSGFPGCHYEIQCSCIWNETKSSCGTISEEVITPECEGLVSPRSLGSCRISQFSGEDNCDDGFLTYDWTAFWSWEENVYSSSSQVPGGVTPVQTPDGYWHSPSILLSSCAVGKNTVPCPTGISLPFFGILNLFLTLGVIGIIYSFSKIFK